MKILIPLYALATLYFCECEKTIFCREFEESEGIPRCSKQTTVMTCGQQLGEENLNYGVDIEILNGSVTELSDRIQFLENLVTTLYTTIKSGSMDLEAGWVGLFNGYQYKRTLQADTWNNSRNFCLDLGADLAETGIQTLQNRKIIQRSLNLYQVTDVWVGLKKEENNVWRWISGFPSDPSHALWPHDRPADGADFAGCAFINTYQETPYSYSLNCTHITHGLCEREWQP